MWISWLLFSLRGRIRRRDWWIGVLALNGLYLLGTAVLVGRAGGELLSDGPASPAETALSLLLIWPATAMGVKREHDRDRSGWMAMLMSGAAPGLFTLASAFAVPGWALIVLGLFALAGLVWSVLVLGILDGTAGDNRFGPSPKRLDPPQL